MKISIFYWIYNPLGYKSKKSQRAQILLSQPITHRYSESTMSALYTTLHIFINIYSAKMNWVCGIRPLCVCVAHLMLFSLKKGADTQATPIYKKKNHTKKEETPMSTSTLNFSAGYSFNIHTYIQLHWSSNKILLWWLFYSHQCLKFARWYARARLRKKRSFVLCASDCKRDSLPKRMYVNYDNLLRTDASPCVSFVVSIRFGLVWFGKFIIATTFCVDFGDYCEWAII